MTTSVLAAAAAITLAAIIHHLYQLRRPRRPLRVGAGRSGSSGGQRGVGLGPGGPAGADGAAPPGGERSARRRLAVVPSADGPPSPARPRTPATAAASRLPCGPGVFRAEASAGGGDALERGREAAERLLRGGPGRGPRRGKKAALDVIVVGASLAGASAALHLLGAGLRVLLVDERLEVAPPAALHDQLRELLVRLPRTSVPLLTGHRVTAVVERPDGMLELHAERAAWYTANVLFVGDAPCAAQAA